VRVIIREIEVRATRPARRYVAFAVGVVALLARLVYLFRKPLWFDELFTLWLSRQAPGRVLHALQLDPGPPLFYFFEGPLVRLAAIVALDAVARTLPYLAIGMIFLAEMRRETSAGARFVALLATSPLLFFYSAEARAYALVAALGFLLFVADFRLRSRHGRLAWAALAATALPWTHYLGVFVVAGSILLCLVRKKWSLALAQVAAAVPFAVWIPIALRQPAAAVSWSDQGGLRTLAGALGGFGSWPGVPAYFSRFDLPLPWLGALLGAGVIGSAALSARKSRAVRDALLFAGLPLLLAAAAGFWKPVYFAGRTEMMTLPVALWAFARAARRSAAARWLTTASATVGCLLIAGALLLPPAIPSYSATAAVVSSSVRAGDLVVASDGDYLPLRLAADRGELRASLVGIPSEIETHPGWFEPGRLAHPDAERSRLGAAVGGVPPGNRIFFAVPPDPAPRSLVLPLVRGGRARVLSPSGSDPVLVLER
jgi:hypothetical protein